jgi:hypothetical protein
MKKFLQSLIVALFMVPFCVNAQDTIVGWTFTQNADTSLYANFGITSNLGARFIAAEDTGGVSRIITWTNGVADYAATAEGWDAGEGIKFWSIKFKAQGYEDLKLYSKQRSGGNNPGPKYFKAQYRFSGGDFMDIPGSDTITVGNDWTTGVISNLALPAEMSDTSVSLYIRWLQITNTASSGGLAVTDSGINKIDEIFILGTPTSSSIKEQKSSLPLNIYPNPATDVVTIEAQENTVITLLDMVGKVVSEARMESAVYKMNVSELNSGIYFISVVVANTGERVTRKLVIR